MVFSCQSSEPVARSRGFTLVEMLVVAPMVLLMLGGIIAMIINMSNSAMRAGAQANLQNDVLYALDAIEQDIKLSTNSSASTASQIQLENLTTDKSPYDENRSLLKASDCSVASDGVATASALKYTVLYRVSGTKLQRVPTFPSGCAQTSSNIWQTRETEEYIDVKTGGTISMTVTKDNDDSPRALKVTISATRSVAGEDVSFTGSIYAKSLNIQ